MKKHIVLLITILCVISCRKSVIEAPKNLIDEDKMVEILYDVSILEAIKVTNPQSLRARGINSKTYIYKKFKIDSLQFALSDKYYAGDVKNYAKMYKKIIDRIDYEKKKDSLANLPKAVKK